MGKGDDDTVQLSEQSMNLVQTEDGCSPARSEVCSENNKSVIVVHNGKEFGSQKYSHVLNRSSYVAVRSDPVLNALGSTERAVTYSEQKLPLSAFLKSDTLVISDSRHVTYRDVIDSSNETLALCFEEDHLPNETALTAKLLRKKGKMWICHPSRYLLPKNQKAQYKQCPNGGGSSKGGQTETGGGGQTSCVTGHTSLGFGSSLVTGLGSGIGEGGGGDDDPWYNRPVDLPRSHYDDYVLWDDDMESDNRDVFPTLTTTPTELQMDPFAFISRLDDIPDLGPPLPVQSPTNDPFVEVVPQTPTQSTEQSSDIGSSFDIIHLMSKPSPMLGLVTPANPVLRCQMMSPVSPSPSTLSLPPTPMQAPTPMEPPTPSLPPTPMQPPTPSLPPTPVQPPTPSSISSSTPATPIPSNLLQPETYVKDDLRYCELSVPRNIPQPVRILPLRALFYSADLCFKYKHCMDQPYDLKVANDVRAKLCECNLDLEQSKLVFTLPKECKPIDQWLAENEDRADVRDRKLILQQVINTLAAIHTIGNEDLLSLWGAFMVWVAPDLRVYLLVDFPVLLQKQQAFASWEESPNPRVEDIKAVQKLYEQILKPYTTLNTSWVSPGVKQLLSSFESLLADPSSGSRMAEIARMLGEKRMCRLEVDLFTLPVTIYSVEHEPLQEALYHLQSMVPYSIAQVWQVIWSSRPSIVGQSDVATADGVMQLKLVPVACATREGLYITSDGTP